MHRLSLLDLSSGNLGNHGSSRSLFLAAANRLKWFFSNRSVTEYRRQTRADRWARTKIRNLVNLGVSLKSAIQHAVSSASYWHMARSPALQQALSNAWLQAQGLVSVKELWCKAQGYTTAKG